MKSDELSYGYGYPLFLLERAVYFAVAITRPDGHQKLEPFKYNLFPDIALIIDTRPESKWYLADERAAHDFSSRSSGLNYGDDPLS
jgi:hypothetical protein